MEYTVYLTLFPVAMGILLLTIYSVWKYRNTGVGSSLLWYFIVVFFVLCTNVVELIAETDRWTRFWGLLQIPFIFLIPVPWLAFALHFSGVSQQRIKRIIPPLSIIPLVNLIVIATPLRKPFLYLNMEIVRRSTYSTIDPEYGPWFWISGVYFYALLIFSAILITRFILSGSGIARRQAIWIFLGIYFPLIVNFLYILPLPFMTYKDFTPLAYPLSALFFFIGIYWKQLLEIVPVGRNQVLRDMTMGILILDSKHRLMDFNRKASEVLKLKEESQSKYIRDIPEMKELLRIVNLDHESSFEREIFIEGETRFFDVQVQKINQTNGKQIGLLITLNDVTFRVGLIDEKMRLLIEMQRSKEKLIQAQSHMIQQEKLASIGLISAGISHELKNPLSYIYSNYRMMNLRLKQLEEMDFSLWKEQYLEELQEMAFESMEGLDRMKDVVDNLQIFTHPHSNRENEPYDIHEGLDSALRILRIEEGHEMRLIRQYGHIPALYCHPSELNQVFLNLLKNGLDCANSGEEIPEIGVYTWSEGNCIICEFINNGPPIDTTQGDKIFEPFFTTKDPGKGTGLGLSIAWNIIVKIHQGKLTYRVEEGETVFRIELPLSENRTILS